LKLLVHVLEPQTVQVFIVPHLGASPNRIYTTMGYHGPSSLCTCTAAASEHFTLNNLYIDYSLN